ncbi:hypothetical protein Tsubulata_032547 [Turnera subulata]|uniref:Cytochrome b561 and DOMON domain-containing protein n=1 Tax=Turnera subulata TaxID=218843 RepID=A0A9Q0JBR9_9ROSI|nr:hypothetical protein Tsubulata_032547 [Turnera subulata]
MTSTTVCAVIISALFLVLSAATAHYIPCSESFSLLAQTKNISNCKKQTTLGVEFGWEINKQNANRVDILVGVNEQPDLRWLAWGVNPQKRPQMIGTRAIIMLRHLNGSLSIHTYNITSDIKQGCKLLPSEVEVGFENKLAEYEATTKFYTLHATVILPSWYNISRLNHVWQVGLEERGLQPMMHPKSLDNVDSTETINLMDATAEHVDKHVNHLRMVHGILNIIGWGTFLPAGVIIARYSRYPLESKDKWYYFHVSCQITGYILGTSGWVVGLWLGHISRYYTFRTHRLYSMLIFAFTTLQALAIRLKPEETDEYRKHWNLYHHCLGYSLLVVISLNMFHGINILKPHQAVWRWAYVGILALLGVIVIAFEICTWAKFMRKPKPKPQEDPAAPGRKENAGNS